MYQFRLLGSDKNQDDFNEIFEMIISEIKELGDFQDELRNAGEYNLIKSRDMFISCSFRLTKDFLFTMSFYKNSFMKSLMG